MGYLATFEKARTTFRTTLDGLGSTEIMMMAVRNDKAKNAADALDKANGKSVTDMSKAAQAYPPAISEYFLKVNAQIAKEKIDKGKAKTAVSVFKVVADKIKTDFEADLGKKQTSDADQASTPKSKEAVDANTAGANAAAKFAAERHLKLALEDFTKRRQEHLDAVTKIAGEVATTLRDVKTWNTAGRQAVTTAADHVSKGNIFGAKKATKDALEFAAKSQTAASDLRNAYDVRITKAFQKDRNLGAGSYENLRADQREDFVKGQKGAIAIFNKAVETGTQVLKSIQEAEALANQTATYAKQVEAIGNQKDVSGLFLESLAGAEKEVKELGEQITADIDKLSLGNGQLVGAKTTLEEAKSPKPEVKNTAVTNAPIRAKGLEEKIAKLKGDVARLKNLVNGAAQAVPPAQKSNPKVKEALTALATAAVTIQRKYIEFEQGTSKVIADLRALK